MPFELWQGLLIPFAGDDARAQPASFLCEQCE